MANYSLRNFPIEFIKPFIRSFCIMKRSNAVFFQKRTVFRKYWRFVYILPCCVSFFISLVTYAVKVTKEGCLVELANMFPVIFVFIQGSFKGFTVVTKSDEISYVIKKLSALWPFDEELQENQISAKNKLLRKLNIFETVYYWMTIVGCWQYIFSPVIECLFRILVLSQEVKLRFPFGDSFPFDPTVSWARYFATYIFQYFSMMKIVYFLLGGEILLIAMTAHLSTLFALLKDDLLAIKPELNGSETQDELIGEDEIRVCKERQSDLGRIVSRHQTLILLRDRIDDIFNKIIFCNLLFATIVICFFGFMATTAKNPGDIARNFVGVVASIVPIFSLCYYGQLLQEASSGLADSAYSNLWYKGSTRYQKTLCFIIFRCQKPCCITSLKYAPVTLATFTTVMSTTWSYFSLILSVYDE